MHLLSIDITKAIIAGIATILAAVITLLLKEYFDRRKERYEKVDSRIRDVVYGKWKGYFEQTLEGSPQTILLEMELKVSSSGNITGKAKFPFKSETYEVNIKGGFYSQRFLKMDYENSDKAILQFGAFIFRLSDSAKKLTGYFVGHGHLTGNIIGGNATLEKV